MMKRKTVTKAALSISLVLTLLWLVLGASSSVAWFKEDDVIVNALLFGDLKINLSYKVSGKYEKVDQTTEIFSDRELYEPGYTHITFFKIENNGSVPFNYDLAIVPDIASTVTAMGVLGNSIDLADYIKFGLVTGSTEEEVQSAVSTREAATAAAVNRISNYSQNGGYLSPGETDYAALILYMPTEVDNSANYRGDVIPEISFGISAIATQAD